MAVGDVYTYGAYLWRCIAAHTTQGNWPPDLTPALWRKVEVIPDGAVRVWQTGVDYALGDTVFYPDDKGNEYACITAHLSQEGWEPPNTPALWTKKEN